MSKEKETELRWKQVWYEEGIKQGKQETLKQVKKIIDKVKFKDADPTEDVVYVSEIKSQISKLKEKTE